MRRRRLSSNCIPHWMTWRYIRNNITWVIWLVLYFVVNIVLFVEAAVRHREGVRVLRLLLSSYISVHGYIPSSLMNVTYSLSLSPFLLLPPSPSPPSTPPTLAPSLVPFLLLPPSPSPPSTPPTLAPSLVPLHHPLLQLLPPLWFLSTLHSSNSCPLFGSSLLYTPPILAPSLVPLHPPLLQLLPPLWFLSTLYSSNSCPAHQLREQLLPLHVVVDNVSTLTPRWWSF